MGRKSRANRSDEKRKVNDEVKDEICQLIRRIALSEHWSQKELAFRLGTTQARVSYIVRHRTHRLSVDQLLIYLAILRPSFRFLISP